TCLVGNGLFTLLGLCVGLVASNQDFMLKGFNFTKFSGVWYEIAFTSMMDVYDSPHKVEKMGGMVVKIEGDLLALTITYYNGSHCVLEKVTASQGEFPEKFKVITAAGNKDVVIVDTDYKTYTIMDITFLVSGVVQKAMKLYTRKLYRNEEVLKKFHKVALEHGYSMSDIQQPKDDCEWALPWGSVLNS
uniref:Lipocalin/cytosolic fatty-acid binding domain-containing protein n=1 Tax=Jaculus jaculus TaxID=51337 RepID=A0A8C5JZU2_JACJA